MVGDRGGRGDDIEDCEFLRCASGLRRGREGAVTLIEGVGEATAMTLIGDEGRFGLDV